MVRANQDIRRKAKAAGVFHWEIAEFLGMHDSNFCRMLRRELPPGKKAEIFTIIKRLSGTRREV